VVARFASACAAVVTLPLAYACAGARKVVWGLHDIAARARFPRDLMTLAMPWTFLVEAWQHADESFLRTGRWETLRRRSVKDQPQ